VLLYVLSKCGGNCFVQIQRMAKAAFLLQEADCKFQYKELFYSVTKGTESSCILYSKKRAVIAIILEFKHQNFQFP
jgi:hypothetical protein